MSTFRPLLVLGLLGLFAGVIVRLWLTGGLLMYIHPATVLLTAAAGLLLVGLLVMAIRQRDGADLTRGQVIALALVVPAVAFIQGQPLSSAIAQQRQTETAVPLSSRGGGTLQKVTQSFSILDWQRAWDIDPTHRRYDRAPVAVTGFLMTTGTERAVGRLVVSCCAVDAAPTRLLLATDAPLPADGTWVTITGSLRTDRDVPVVNVATVTLVDAPEQPYLY